jgi:hypothetical protein
MDLSDLNEFNTFTRKYGGVLGLAIKTFFEHVQNMSQDCHRNRKLLPVFAKLLKVLLKRRWT